MHRTCRNHGILIVSIASATVALPAWAAPQAQDQQVQIVAA